MLEKDVQNNRQGTKRFEGLTGLLHGTNRDSLKVRSLEIAFVNKKCFCVVIKNKYGRATGIHLTHHLRDVIYFRFPSIGHGQNDRKSGTKSRLALDRDASS